MSSQASSTRTTTGKINGPATSTSRRPRVATPATTTAAISQDFSEALAVIQEHYIDGNKVEDTKRMLTGGFRPYAIQVSPKGDVAVVVNQGGNAGDIDTINVIDLKPPFRRRKRRRGLAARGAK